MKDFLVQAGFIVGVSALIVLVRIDIWRTLRRGPKPPEARKGFDVLPPKDPR